MVARNLMARSPGTVEPATSETHAQPSTTAAVNARLTPGHSLIESLAVSADGRLVLAGGADRCLRVWDLESGRCVHVPEGHLDGVNKITMTADCRYVLSGDRVPAVRIWQLDWDYDFSAPADRHENAHAEPTRTRPDRRGQRGWSRWLRRNG